MHLQRHLYFQPEHWNTVCSGTKFNSHFHREGVTQIRQKRVVFQTEFILMHNQLNLIQYLRLTYILSNRHSPAMETKKKNVINTLLVCIR